MNETLRAGVARRIISPPRGIYLIGYGDRVKGNVGIHDDLTATALALEAGGACLVLVALDILTINEFIVDRIRAAVAPLEVILCCSHTHSGPIAYADARAPRRDRACIDSLVGNVAQAVREAHSRLQPARLEFSSGSADVGINRREKMPDGQMEIGRNPQGARDRSLQVLSVLDEAGGRLATVVNYACHGTVLGPDNLLVSADWIGVMRAQVEQDLGGTALFLQGAAANINPDMYWDQACAFEKMTEQGMAVAQAVRRAVDAGAEPLPSAPLRLARRTAWLPTEAPATSARPPKNYRKPLLALAKMPAFMAVFTDFLLARRYPWRPLIEARNGFWSVPLRVNAARLGDLALVTFAAETFTEIGMKVKDASPARQTLFASVSDGCVSYLHTAEAHPEGGYEVDVAPLAYRYPGRLQAGSEAIALAAADEMLQALWGKERTE